MRRFEAAEIMALHTTRETLADAGTDNVDLLARHEMVDPDLAARLHERVAIDPELDEIALKALNKRPEDRYATGSEFAEQLELWAARALVGTSGRGPAHPRRPAYPSSGGPSSGSVRQAPRSAGEQSSVVGGETLDNPTGGSRSRTHGAVPGTVILVKPVPNPRGPLVKILAGAAIGLVVLAVGLFALTRPKAEPTPAPKATPDGGMKEWKRG